MAQNAVKQRAQQMLFGDPLPDLDVETGYRGPIACRAAGITYRQLDYWDRTGLISPTVRTAHGSGSQRLYSFRDILVLSSWRPTGSKTSPRSPSCPTALPSTSALPTTK